MKKLKFQVVGYMGVVEGRAFFDKISDSYCNSTEHVRIAEVFKSRSAAKRRYEQVVKVQILEIGPRKAR